MAPSAEDLIPPIAARYPCRTPQITLISSLLSLTNSILPAPQALVVHGFEDTGKTVILRALFQGAGVRHAWVQCNECITARQLTERITSIVREVVSIGTEEDEEQGGRMGRGSEANGLAVELSRMLSGNEGKFFLVLDRVDRVGEVGEGKDRVFAGLRRLGEMIPGLTVIFVMTVPTPRQFASADLPHIEFPNYTKEESIQILSLNPLPIPPPPKSTDDEDSENNDEDSEEELDPDEVKVLQEDELWLFQKFAGMIWDSLGKGAARGLKRFQSVVEKNWKQFVEPVVRGDYTRRQFASLYLLNKEMFRKEETVVDWVVRMGEEGGGKAVVGAGKSHDLPLYSKYLLCAAYLASYNMPRHDAQLFSKAAEGKKKRRGGRLGQRAGSTRKISRRLLGPASFPIERLLAIFHAIVPHEVPSTVDVLSQVATLTSMRLMLKATVVESLDGAAKWKCNCNWDYVRGVARGVRFEVEEFLVE